MVVVRLRQEGRLILTLRYKISDDLPDVPLKARPGASSSPGSHTFRRTYRSWLDETGTPMKVRQELTRYALFQTTMNVYGQAMPESKREANGKVVTMVLKPLRASA